MIYLFFVLFLFLHVIMKCHAIYCSFKLRNEIELEKNKKKLYENWKHHTVREGQRTISFFKCNLFMSWKPLEFHLRWRGGALRKSDNVGQLKLKNWWMTNPLLVNRITMIDTKTRTERIYIWKCRTNSNRKYSEPHSYNYRIVCVVSYIFTAIS